MNDYEILSHRRTGGSTNPKIQVTATADGPDESCGNYAIVVDGDITNVANLAIKFHTGPPAEGVNGVTDEALLAVLIDRIDRWQAGRFACMENHHTLLALREAMGHMGSRTFNRTDRGVEGTQTP